MGFASISTDIYLPGMPTMSHALGADMGTAEWTVSGYLIGFALGQLFWGPVGDRFGRRLPVATGIALFVLGSAGCAMATGIWWVIAARVVQAAGASAGVVLGRAMVRDLYQGPRAASMMSTLMTVMAIAPLIGPLVGGQVLLVMGWRAIFWVLVGVGMVTLALLTTLPETLPPKRRHRIGAGEAIARYVALLRNRRTLAYIGAGAFFYGGMFAYVAGSPFAYITYHRLPPQYYGLLFGLGIVGIMGSNMINARLVHRFGVDTMLKAGIVWATVSALLNAVTTWTDMGGLPGLVLALFLYISATGLIVANSIAGVLEEAPQGAGAASALVGAVQYGSGIFSSALIGAFANGTPAPMGTVILVTALASLACLAGLRAHHSGL
ncbi:MAG: Bcr/CflA family efflux MFS transporter [Novosphingobium sp.]|nr:Bcr/CflA family efflux MFS transporter [Novosphingobium sp.]